MVDAEIKVNALDKITTLKNDDYLMVLTDEVNNVVKNINKTEVLPALINYINALDYGVVYNDSSSATKTANTTAINNMISDASTTGGTIFFPSGGIVYCNSFTIDGYLKIIGAGALDLYRLHVSDAPALINGVALFVDCAAGDDCVRIEGTTNWIDHVEISDIAIVNNSNVAIRSVLNIGGALEVKTKNLWLGSVYQIGVGVSGDVGIGLYNTFRPTYSSGSLYQTHENLNITSVYGGYGLKYGIKDASVGASNATHITTQHIDVWFKQADIQSANFTIDNSALEGRIDSTASDVTDAIIYVANPTDIVFGYDEGGSRDSKKAYKNQPCYIYPIFETKGLNTTISNTYREANLYSGGSPVFTYDDGVNGSAPIFCAYYPNGDIAPSTYPEGDIGYQEINNVDIWTMLYDPYKKANLQKGRKSIALNQYKNDNYNFQRELLIKSISEAKGATSILKQVFFDKDGYDTTLTNRGSLANDMNILNSYTYNQANKMSPTQLGLMKLLNFASSPSYGSFYWNFADADGLSFGDGSTDSDFTIAWCGIIPATLANTYICAKLDTTTGSPQREYEIAYFATGAIRIVLWDNSTGGSLSWQSAAGVITANSKISLVVTYDPTASPLHQGIKVFLNGTELTPDSNSTSGTYVAMENTTAVVGDYYLNTSGNKAWSFLGKVGYLDIRSGFLTEDEIIKLDALLRGFAGVDTGYSTRFGFDYLTGNANTALGSNAGRYITDGTTPNITGTNSVFLGYGTKAASDSETNQIVIGHNTIGAGSNTVTLGNTSITKTVLQGVVIQGTYSSEPTGVEGGIYYNSTDKHFYGYNGTSWVQLDN